MRARQVPRRRLSGVPALTQAASARFRVIRQPPLADEVAMPLDRRPGRHVTPAGHLRNLPGAPANLLVGGQWERSSTAVVMAWGAPRVDDRRDVGRKRWRCPDGRKQAKAPGAPTSPVAGATRTQLLQVRDDATNRLSNSRRRADAATQRGVDRVLKIV